MKKAMTCMLLGGSLMVQANELHQGKEIMPTQAINQLQGAPDVVTVGSDGSCDYNNIQDAIDNADEVRVATNGSPYFENILFETDDATVLKGSYADCTMAALNITDLSTTIIDGSGSGHAIEVNGLLDVSISHLTLGHADVGIHVAGSDMTNLRLNQVFSFNNNSFGVEVVGSNKSVYINNSRITNNSDSGLYCNGETNAMSVFGESVIADNHSPVGAGGIMVRGGCSTYVLSPVIIEDNMSDTGGGGIKLTEGSDVYLLGTPNTCGGMSCGSFDSPVILKNNNGDADDLFPGFGGAAYVLGADTELTVVNALIESNYARDGGAVSVNNGIVTVYAYEDGISQCWKPGSCNLFTGNSGIFGGVFELKGTSESLISGSYITATTGNQVAYIWEEAEVVFSNSIIAGNGGSGFNHIFRLRGFQGTPTLNAEYLTIADNQLEDTVIANEESNFRIHSSIIAEDVDVYFETEDISASFECMLVNESASFSAGGTVTVGAPEFMDAANGDYHNKPSSPAIDYCYEITSTVYNDIDFDEYHGYDDPNKMNLHGTYDLGADEYIITNDIIFKHGFEQE